jgi:23S rRNA pseudouridine1911/1915/1917 synthase
MTPQIVYEDDDLLVVNKPSGLIVHKKNKDDTQPSVVDWVVKNYPELENVGEPFIASGSKVPRAGIVHRLDKEASGLLVITKNEKSFLYFKNLFQDRKINKYYLALVSGRPKEPKGNITSPLGRIGLKRTTKIIGNKLIDKKEAETSYRTIKEYGHHTLLEVSPKTGRTHQIRVHMNSLGTPIAGDHVYSFKKTVLPHGLNRLFLHAYKLVFKTPSGKSLTLETDPPSELQKVLNMLQ